MSQDEAHVRKFATSRDRTWFERTKKLRRVVHDGEEYLVVDSYGTVFHLVVEEEE